ncbi:MAG: RodZ domain-containing protein [Kiloniellales bacterium]
MSVTHDRDKPEPTLGRGDPEPKLGGQDREPIPGLHDGAPPEPHENVADILRRARKEHGQDLRTVSQVLRIRYVYLEAIESGRFDRLPGTAYVVGFLRTYADYLGLDGGHIVEQFKLETRGAAAKTELIFPEPVTEGRIPGGAILLISVLLMGVAYGGWFYLSNEGRSVADLIPPMPESIARLMGGDEEAPAPADESAETIAASIPEPAMESETAEEAPAAGTESAAIEPAAAQDSTTTAAAPAAQPAAEPAEVSQPAAPPTETVEVAETPAEPEQEAAPEHPLPAPVVVTQVIRLAPAQQPAADSQSESATAAPRTTLAEVVRLQPNLPAPSTDSGAATPSESESGIASAASMEPTPLVRQTLVIPSAPFAPQTAVISSDRVPRVYGENNQGSRIIVRAIQDSWVQVRDRNDALLLTRVLRTGDSYFVPDQDGLTLLTGNAGGIEIEVDGVKVPPIGPVGSVRRQIALDPGRLLHGDSTSQ